MKIWSDYSHNNPNRQPVQGNRAGGPVRSAISRAPIGGRVQRPLTRSGTGLAEQETKGSLDKGSLDNVGAGLKPAPTLFNLCLGHPLGYGL